MSEPKKPMTPDQLQKATEYVLELSRRIETSISEKCDSVKRTELASTQTQGKQVNR